MIEHLKTFRVDTTKLLLALALLAQTPHTADLFHRLVPYAPTPGDSQWLEWLHAWVYAISLESGIYLFVSRGRVNWGNLFAMVSVAVNVGYYWRPEWILFPSTETEWATFWQVLPDMLRAGLISGILPLAIMRYSHEILGHSSVPEPSPQKADRPRVVARPIPVPQIAPRPLVESPEPIVASLAPWLETSKEAPAKPKRASKQAAVFEYLDNHPNAKHIEVSEACGVSVDLVRQYTARWRKSLKLVPAESVSVDIHVNGKNH